MKKHLMILMFLFVSVFALGSCANNNEGPNDTVGTNDQVDFLSFNEDLPERKIIYNVSMSIYTKKLEETISTIKENVNNDEWFDEETIQERRATFTIRIKTARLDQFILDIDNSFNVSNFSKTAKDISLDYLDATNQIAALEAEQARLMNLYEGASLEGMITINRRLAEVEKELLTLKGTLNTFDSLVDYSEVKITVHLSRVAAKDPFFNRLGTAFMNGLSALGVFFDTLAVVVMTLLPFAAVFVPAGVGTYYLVKWYKGKKKL